MPVYADATGRRIEFGAELGRGGEATVYDVVGPGDLVAKIFESPGEAKAEKLRAMLADAAPPAAVCAWPVSTLHNGRGALPVGYLMPKVAHSYALDSLLVPVQRHRDFPAVDWRFIVHAARNLADGVAEVHRKGYIIGDLNENNVRVTKQGEVRFIDCDSFQVRSGVRTLRCEVATLLYWPPELQGVNADAIDRNQNHDAFALAVLLFRMLFLGRHPYAGRFIGGDQPDIPELIRSHRFAFGGRSQQFQVHPPPNALRLQQLPAAVGTLFERAFAPEAAAQHSRPTASEWLVALQGLAKDLVRCSSTTAHWYPRAAGACPWCAIERVAGTVLFVGSGATAASETAESAGRPVDVDALWRAIAAVAAPSPVEQLVPEPAVLRRFRTISAPPAGARRLVSAAKLMWAFAAFYGLISANMGAPDRGMAVGLVTAVLGFVGYAIGRKRSTLQASKLAPARAAVDTLGQAWQLARQEVAGVAQEFSDLRARLEAQVAEHKKLRGDYENELQELRSRSNASQLHKHLQSYSVRGLQLPNIGAGVVRSLEAYGIYTADDIAYDRVRYVKGIGPVRADTLMNWRRQCEARFHFDPAGGVDRGAFAALRQRYVGRHEAIVAALASGPRTLSDVRGRAEQIARARRDAFRGLEEQAEALLSSR